MKNATIFMRNGGFFLTQIDMDMNDPSSIGKRMTLSGYLIIAESRWPKARTLILNLGDVSSIVIEED